MDTRELSIVIPVRNREKLLARCLESVASQTYRPLHVIVVDNGSADGSRRVAEEWALNNHCPGFMVSVLSESKEGAAAARNRGLKEVESEFVMFFDSDDTMHADLAERVMEGFRARPEADLLYWKAMHYPLSGRPYVMPYARKRLLVNQIQHSILRTQAYAVRTRALRSAGSWNSSLPVWNDWELGIRLIVSGLKCVAMGEVLTDVYAQPVSLTGCTFSERSGERELAIYEAERIVLKSGIARAGKALRMINARRATLAARYYREENYEAAEPLLREALSNPLLNGFRRLLLKFCYIYASRGGRGSVRLLAPFL